MYMTVDGTCQIHGGYCSMATTRDYPAGDVNEVRVCGNCETCPSYGRGLRRWLYVDAALIAAAVGYARTVTHG